MKIKDIYKKQKNTYSIIRLKMVELKLKKDKDVYKITIKTNKNDKIMNAKEFYEAVKQMRKLQKDYFKYRINLEEAKAQEAKIDAEIERIENILHPQPTQTKLNF